jgi:internalin A
MPSIKRSSTAVSVLLLVLLMSGVAAVQAQSPRVVLYEDPALGADRLHAPLLISEGRGYRIQCASQEDEEAVIRGLGFATVPSQILSAVDPAVVDAAPASNPLLCPSKDNFRIQIFAKDGPDGRVYYLQFPVGFGATTVTDRLYVPRCAGLVEALRLDLSQAQLADPTPFFTGKVHQISCLTGNGPFGAPPTTFAAWCMKGDRSPAETATVNALLEATPVGTAALGNAAACNEAQQFLAAIPSVNLNGKGVQSLAPLSVLPHLTSLSLVGNQITDLAPLAKLRALTFLDLSHNQVSNVVALAPLTTLTSLELSDNRIQDVRFLSALTRLTSLSLNGNALLDLSPLQFLPALSDLSLARNGLTGDMLEPLTGLAVLTRLDVSDNRIETFAHLGAFPSTVRINISGNPIAATGGDSFLDVCILHRDDATPFGQTIRVLAQAAGGGTCNAVNDALRASTTLDLKGKNISDVGPIGRLVHLTVLDLSDNAIGDVAPLAALVELVDLNLAKNNITDIRPIGALAKLDSFDAADNPIAVDDFLAACVMRAHANKLTPAQAAEVSALIAVSGRSGCGEADRALRQVRDADVEGRGLTTLAYFPVMERLERLELQRNAITDLTPLRVLPELSRVWAQQNQLASMQVINPLRQLEFLNIEQNPLTSLEGISALNKLRQIIFSSTRVRSVRPLLALPLLELATMRNLPLLFNGFSEYCLVHRFDSIALGEERAFMAAIDPALATAHVDPSDCAAVDQWAGTVTVLNLNKKGITSVRPIVFFTELQELQLYDNSISDASSIASLRKLTTLNLTSNQLTSVPRFSSSQLKYLYLDSNRITSIGNLSNLSQLEYVGVKDNVLVDPSPVGGIGTLDKPDFRNNQIAILGSAVSVLGRTPYLKGNPVCSIPLPAPIPALTEACRREPRIFVRDIDILIDRRFIERRFGPRISPPPPVP